MTQRGGSSCGAHLSNSQVQGGGSRKRVARRTGRKPSRTTNRRTSRRTGRKPSRRSYRRTNRQAGRKLGRRTSRRTGRKPGRRTDRRTNRRKEIRVRDLSKRKFVGSPGKYQCVNGCDKNTKRGYFTGKEPSPKGLGYCARCTPLGVTMKGVDGNLWENKKYSKGKRWVKVRDDMVGGYLRAETF